MHRSLRMIGLAALVALPATLSAQQSRPVSIGVSGGVSLPMGDLSDGFSPGFNVGGHVAIKPASWSNLSLRIDGTYDRFSSKDEVEILGLSSNLSNIGITGNLVFAFPQSSPAVVRPYVLGGAGAYISKVTVESNGTSLSGSSGNETNVGIQGGVGIMFNLSGFTTFLEAKFVNVFSNSDDNSSNSASSARWIPITFGVRF